LDRCHVQVHHFLDDEVGRRDRHDHFGKQLGDINAQALVANHLFDHFAALFGVALDLTIAQQSLELADFSLFVIECRLCGIKMGTKEKLSGESCGAK
jgi:hypothetical protein